MHLRPTITGLVIDLSGNGLFHRELTVSAKEDADGGCHLGRRGGSGGFGGLFPLALRPSRGPKEVSVVGLLAGPVGIETSGVIPKVPKAGSNLPLV